MEPLKIEIKLAGRFKLSSARLDSNGDEVVGSRRELTGWFDNLILDQGMNYLGGILSTYANACQVGSGTTAPAVSDTGLVSRVAGTSTILSSSSSPASVPPYYVALTRTFRFAEGAAAGNLAEIGVGQTTTTNTLFSRALIKDGMGNPTTITVLSDEILDVTYELRYYCPPTDVTGTIVATGNIGGTYDFILRAANVTSGNSNLGWLLPVTQTQSGTATSYSGDIGAITASPSGTTSNVSQPASITYVNGNFYIDRVLTISSSQGNIVGGIRSVMAKMGIGTYQLQFDPTVPKTSLDVVQLTFRISWARQP